MIRVYGGRRRRRLAVVGVMQDGGPMGWMLVGRQLVAHTLRRQHRRTVRVRVLAHRRPVDIGMVPVTRVHVSGGRHAVHHVAPERVRRRHPLLLLPPVAEPHPHHFLLQLQTVRQRADLLRRGLRLLVEVLLEGPFHGHLDARALFPFAALRRDLIDRRGRARRRVRFLQPFLQQRFQLAHVFKTQLQRLEPADRRLREHVPVEGAQRQADVRLREAQLYPALLELFRERFQVVAGRGLVLAAAHVPIDVVRIVRTLNVSVQRVVDLGGGLVVHQHAVDRRMVL